MDTTTTPKQDFIGCKRGIITPICADGLDKLSKTIFELKPYNKRSARRGIKQILNYDKALGGYTKYIIFY
ncbi:MAG: hypothetical protein IKD35_01980 [Clostridia bacterium]|nr:hypothetical protein [Clostridia bacterium]